MVRSLIERRNAMPEPATIGQFVFSTSLGHIALAWSATGLTRFSLPEQDRSAVERRARKWAEASAAQPGFDELPQDAPAFVAEAVSLARRYADGETVDFSGLPIDLGGADPFRCAIYAAALKLRQGEVVTYGELADRAGFPGMARETGAALGLNPLPLVVPCHRIIAAGGRIGGFSAPGGSRTKERLLAHEGVRVGPPPPAQASFGF